MADNLPPNVKRHGSGFRAVVQVHGKRTYGPTVPTPEEAAQWAASFKGAQVPGLVLTLDDGIERLNADLRQTGAADETFGFYADHLASVVDHFGATCPLHRIDAPSVRRFIEAQQDNGLCNGTIGKRINAIGRILKLAVRDGYLPHDPIANLQRPKHRQKRFRAWSPEEVYDIIDRMLAWKTTKRSGLLEQQRDADLVELLFLTGMRRTEVSRLTATDVDLARREITIHGKTAGRRIPIAKDLEPTMVRILRRVKPDLRLFPTPSAISWVFLAWSRTDRLGLRGFSPHSMRHSFASACAAQGVTPYVLKDLLGHRRIEQVLTYYHSQGGAAREAVDGLMPRSRRASDSPPSGDPEQDPPAESPASA